MLFRSVVSSSATPSSSVAVSTAVVASSSVTSSAPSASSFTSASKPAATTAASSTFAQAPPGVAPSETYAVPAATTAPSSPDYVDEGSREVEPDKNEEYDIVYVTETITVNGNAAAETPCPSDAAKAKRQTFEFKPAPQPAAELAVSSPDSSSNNGQAFQVIPEAPAPVEPAPHSLGDPAFTFKNVDSSPISAHTRPIIPTLDGSCGLVSGFRCEYDSILGTIPGCCSKFGKSRPPSPPLSQNNRSG